MSYIVTILILITWMIYTSSANCIYAEEGDSNLKLVFDIMWTIEEQKKVVCYNDQTLIGECIRVFLPACTMTYNSSGKYNISTNEQFSSVFVTIINISEITLGDYVCAKENSRQNKSICIQNAVNLSSLTLDPHSSVPVSYPVCNVQSNFSCITSLSRPAARIDWFVGVHNITFQAIYVYNSSHAKSILQYTPTSCTNETLSCVAQYVFKSTHIMLQKEMNMLVQYPVSKPVISTKTFNASDTVTIREDRYIDLKCSSTSFPPPTYQWMYPGGSSNTSKIRIELNRTANGESIKCLAQNTYYTLNGNTTTGFNTAETLLNLNVVYPPLNVRFRNSDKMWLVIESTITVVVGDSISIVCESDANPSATTFWQDNMPHSNTLTARDIQKVTNWTCVAFNVIESVQENVTKTLTTLVLHGPNIPIVKYSILPNVSATGLVKNNETITVIEGSSLQLTCVTLSFPSASYSWGYGLDGDIHAIYNVSRRTNTSYTCSAENKMETTFKGTITGKNMSTLHLNILYGPHNLSALFNNSSEFQGVLRVIKGWSFTISCNAISRPSSRISWYGFPLEEKENYLMVNNADIEISKNITCIATNTMFDSLGHNVTKSANLTFAIDVLHPPVAQAIGNKIVLKYANLTVACHLSNYGNPTATNFTWTKLGQIAFLRTGQTLVLNRADLSDEGVYQCKVTNTMEAIGKTIKYGSAQSNFTLDVQYGATIERFYANITSDGVIIVDHNQSVELICEVDGDPRPVVYVINGTDLHVTLNGSFTASQTYSSHIQRARCEYDTGDYKCKTRNAYNTKEQEQTLTLIVQCSPRASPFAPPETKVFKAPKDPAVLTFTIKAYPRPSFTNFTWYKNNSIGVGWTLLDNDTHYTISVSEDRLQTELRIRNVQENDYGTYQINVSSVLGSTSELFFLIAMAIPEMPKKVRVVGQGISEIQLEWIPGFNGGKEQTFTISYTDISLQMWVDVHVPVNSYSHTLQGLRQKTTYRVKVRAENSIGNSSWTDDITISTLSEIVDKRSTSAVIGGVIAGMTGICIIVAVIVYLRHRSKELKDSSSEQILPKRSRTGKQEKIVYENISMSTPNPTNITITSSAITSEEGHTPISQLPASTVLKRNIKNNLHSGPIGNPQHSRRLPFVDDTRLSGVDVNVHTHGRDSFLLEHDPIYDNLVKKTKQFISKDINILNLREVVMRAKEDRTEVSTEFSALNVASELIQNSTDTALKSANVAKNRYKKMYPYDKNRVKLSLIGTEIDTDFINASFIDGYSSPKKYIAAQGPLECTIFDFWRMIWEQNIGIIAMVTNLIEESQRKCFQYWPASTTNNCQYKDYTVQLLSENTYANFVVRTLHCTMTGSTREHKVTHLHFTAWPDKDVPDTAISLLQFWRKVRHVANPDGAPWIVHCSAGVGRTGTLIALDYLYDQGVAEKQINVFGAVLLLRQQRINMVQTKNQYLYLHEVLCDALCSIGEVLTHTAFIESKRTIESLNQEYQKICQSHVPDRVETEADGEYMMVLDGEKPDNVNKNVDPCVVPDDKYRPGLNLTLNILGHNDYINAVFISTYRKKNRLILTQTARVSSELDFVRLLHDHFIRTVVTFGEEVEPYMPNSNDSFVFGPFTATTITGTLKQHYQDSVVKFKHIAEHDSFEVRFVRFTHWSNEFDTCNIRDLMGLLMDVHESACDRPVIFQCRDGYSQSGLCAVLWCLVERNKLDGEVAVAETVRMVRRRRKQVITSEAQYRFCYQFMKEYIEGCLVYANT